MSRLNIWDENTPDGDVDEADELDDFMRIMKVDLREIVNQIAGVAEATPLADPAVPVDRNLGALRGDIDAVDVTIGSQAFTKTQSWLSNVVVATAANTQSSAYAEIADSGAGSFLVVKPLSLPVGTVITKIEARILRNNAGADMQIQLVSYNDGASTIITGAAALTTSASPQWIASPSINHTVLVDRVYTLEMSVTMPGAAGAAVRFLATRLSGTSASAALRE